MEEAFPANKVPRAVCEGLSWSQQREYIGCHISQRKMSGNETAALLGKYQDAIEDKRLELGFPISTRGEVSRFSLLCHQ